MQKAYRQPSENSHVVYSSGPLRDGVGNKTLKDSMEIKSKWNMRVCDGGCLGGRKESCTSGSQSVRRASRPTRYVEDIHPNSSRQRLIRQIEPPRVKEYRSKLESGKGAFESQTFFVEWPKPISAIIMSRPKEPSRAPRVISSSAFVARANKVVGRLKGHFSHDRMLH